MQSGFKQGGLLAVTASIVGQPVHGWANTLFSVNCFNAHN